MNNEVEQGTSFTPGSNPGQATDPLIDNRYRIQRLLGEGGMGAVYLAEHVGLGKQVAVKLLHADLANRDDVVKRFNREAQAAAAIRHKNIIEVFDVGVSGAGEPYLVMEYLEGEGLRDLMTRVGRIELAAACALMEPVLLALAAAHRQGIIHRDLKPENIFLSSRTDEPLVVKIIDFGISKIATAGPDRWRTQTGFVLGTPTYMSPEQARGAANLDHRTDLYSVGTILFEMLTAELPFASENFNEFFAKLLTEEPRSSRSVCPDLPAEVDLLLQKAIRKDADQRFQSAAEMLEALKGLAGAGRGSEELALLGANLGERTFAAGDLGLAAAIARRSVAPGPRQPTAGQAPLPPVPEARRGRGFRAKPWLLAGAALAAALMLALTGMALLGRKETMPAVAGPPVGKPIAQPEAAAGVKPPAPDEKPPSAAAAQTPETVPARNSPSADGRQTDRPKSRAQRSSAAGSWRSLGADLAEKARAQVRRIPGRASSNE